MARAWDSTAAVQPEHAATVWNPKGYINNSWPTVTVTATPSTPGCQARAHGEADPRRLSGHCGGDGHRRR